MRLPLWFSRQFSASDPRYGLGVILSFVALVLVAAYDWSGAASPESFGSLDSPAQQALTSADPAKSAGRLELSLRSEASSLSPNAQNRLTDHIVDRYRIGLAEARSVVALVSNVGAELRVDPLLLLAVIAVESSFDPQAQSRRGAQGLMQIRTSLHSERFEQFGGVEAAFDPVANVRVGAELLKMFLLREGSTEAALKSYVGAARRPHDSGYSARVLGERDLLAQAAAESSLLVLREQAPTDLSRQNLF